MPIVPIVPIVPTVSIPDDTSSESSRQDVSNADLVGTDPVPSVEISTMEHRSRGVIVIHCTQYTVTKSGRK